MAQISPPPRKRVKRSAEDASKTLPTPAAVPRLFAPFRALGLVTNHVPFAIQTRASKASTSNGAPPRIHIVTCLGKAWLMWEGEKMTLLFVGSELEKPITSLLMDGDAVWAASSWTITKFLRGKPVDRLENPLESTIAAISVFGSRMLGLTEDGTHLLVWDMNTLELVNSITFDPDFTATHMLHPATYLNKVIVASSQGGIQLWNISTSLLIHTFAPQSLRPSSAFSSASAITALVQSPAVDIVGIGFTSGEVSIYDIRADERLLGVNMGSSLGGGAGGDTGRITSLGFRSDGEPILATASSNGHIAFWDLNAGGRLLNVLRGAHEGAVTALEWIPGQPLMISCGVDNSVKQWLFDSPTEPPRLLKFRSGHQSPPHLIRYYGSDGKSLLSASRDRSLRCMSIVRDSRSFELSQGSLGKKSASLSLPLSHFKYTPITSLSFSSARSKDWEDVLTSHASDPSTSSFVSSSITDPSASGSSYTRTWSVQNKRVGRWTLGLNGRNIDSRGSHSVPSTSSSTFNDPSSVLSLSKSKSTSKSTPADKAKAKTRETGAGAGTARSTFVTSCGNFGLVGSSTGVIGMWNMQSGILRRAFDCGILEGDRIRDREIRGKGTVSEGDRPITGICVDPLNTLLVACTLDGTIHFFDFHTAKLNHVIRLPSSVVSLTLQPDSGLAAIICDDLTVRMIDLETRRVVREYGGFKGRILDITFSPDSRWLVTTSLDSIIRTFDIPTGKLVDAFKTASVATSVSFSPTGDFLATAHVDSVGVYLWANRAQYAEVSLRSFDEASMLRGSISLPSLQGSAEDEALESLTALTLDQSQDVYTTPDQLSEELVTLTLLPRSKWQTLLNLETITQRNKPKEAPKVPEKAPFFLPTLPGVDHRFNVETGKGGNNADSTKGGNSAKRRQVSGVESDFQRRLLDEDTDGDYENFFVYMKTLSPAGIDVELRSLSSPTSVAQTNSFFLAFISALTARLRTHRDFEAVQTFLAVFLRLHGSDILQSDTEEEDGSRISDALKDLAEVQQAESERVLDLVANSLGTLSFVRDTA